MLILSAAVMAFALVGLSAGTITTVTAGAAAGAAAPVAPSALVGLQLLIAEYYAVHQVDVPRYVFP